MRNKTFKPPYDPACPPPGTRLELGVVAAALKVSVSEMAAAAGMARSTFHRVLSNDWPARTTVQEQVDARQALATLFAERGASAEQLGRLWHAHGHHKGAIHVPNVAQTAAQAGVTTRTPTTNPDEDPEMLLPKQTLSPQARRHFKLFTNPFDGEVHTAEQMYSGADVQYVREAARQCALNAGFVAIVGESGAGKTTVQADLEERLTHEARGTIIIKPGVLGMEESNARGQMLKSADILHAIITTLQPSATVPQTLQARTVRAAKMMTASAETGATHLLLLEEAHALPDATLKHLKRLHELRQGRRPLLGILLLAQPELKVRLANGLRTGALREVAQRCEIVELLPLDNDLHAYLSCRAAAAGLRLDTLMDADAVAQLRARLTRKTAQGAVSMCYPLAVNNMMTRALNTAAEIGVPMVTKDVVAAC